MRPKACRRYHPLSPSFRVTKKTDTEKFREQRPKGAVPDWYETKVKSKGVVASDRGETSVVAEVTRQKEGDSGGQKECADAPGDAGKQRGEASRFSRISSVQPSDWRAPASTAYSYRTRCRKERQEKGGSGKRRKARRRTSKGKKSRRTRTCIGSCPRCAKQRYSLEGASGIHLGRSRHPSQGQSHGVKVQPGEVPNRFFSLTSIALAGGSPLTEDLLPMPLDKFSAEEEQWEDFKKVHKRDWKEKMEAE